MKDVEAGDQDSALRGTIDFNGPDDPEHPQNWRLSRRIWATFMLAMFNLVVTIASSIFGSAQAKVAEQFAVSQEVTILGTSLFLVVSTPLDRGAWG